MTYRASVVLASALAFLSVPVTGSAVFLHNDTSRYTAQSSSSRTTRRPVDPVMRRAAPHVPEQQVSCKRKTEGDCVVFTCSDGLVYSGCNACMSVSSASAVKARTVPRRVNRITR